MGGIQEEKTMKFRLILNIFIYFRLILNNIFVILKKGKQRHFVTRYITFLWTLHRLSYLFYFERSRDQRNNCSKIKVRKCLHYKKARSTLLYSILRFTNITLWDLLIYYAVFKGDAHTPVKSILKRYTYMHCCGFTTYLSTRGAFIAFQITQYAPLLARNA